MSERARRQTRRHTRMQLKRKLSPDGRAWVKEVWEATEHLCSKPLVSPTLIKLGRALADAYAAAERLEGAEIREALFAVVTAGYASRAVLAGPTKQPPLKLALPISSRSSLEHNKGAIAALVDPLEKVANDDFESVMTLPQEVWDVYLSVATLHLQERLLSSTVTWRELTGHRIEAMLRHGYVLRCIDEAFDAKPARRKRR